MSDIHIIISTIIRETALSTQDAIEICEMFFNNFSGTKKRIEECIIKEDYDAIIKYVHQFKGTMLNMRMNQISDLASELNEDSKNRNQLNCLETFRKISSVIESLETQISLYKNDIKLKVLIVEDDFVSGKMIEAIVTKFGHYSLGIVSTAEQAFIHVKKEKPNLIFMDINLSGEMDGIYTAELLNGYYNLYVAFISIHADSKTISLAKQFGVGYIIKPFTAEEIENIIDIVCNKKMSLQNQRTTPSAHIQVKEDNQILFIDFEDIIYFEAQAHIINIYTKIKTFSIRSSLKELLSNDSEKLFLRVHRSFLINKNQIDSFEYNNYSYQINMKVCNKKIPVSKNYVKLVKSILKR